jgi:hypothetical protein
MTDLAEFLARATDDVAATRTVGSETWAAYDELDPSARLLLLRFAVDTDEPVWSSKAMEDLVEAQLAVPAGGVCDILAGALDLWAQHDPELTATVGNFVKALAVLCFTQHRRSYQKCDFAGLLDRFAAHPSRAGAYLLAHTLPPEHWAAARPVLAAALDGTPQREQVELMLSDDD